MNALRIAVLCILFHAASFTDSEDSISAPSISKTQDVGSRYFTISWNWNGFSDATWALYDDDPVDYDVQWGIYNISKPIASSNATKLNVLHFTIDKLLPATKYLFRVRAVKHVILDMVSDFTEVVVLTRSEVPAQPSPPFLTENTGSTFTVAWAAPYDGGAVIGGYQVYMNDGPGTDILPKRNLSIPSFRADDLIPGVYYSVQVQAKNTVGLGPLSKVVIVRTSTTPEKVDPRPRLVSRTPYSIRIQYTAPAPNDAPINGYRVECRQYVQFDLLGLQPLDWRTISPSGFMSLQFLATDLTPATLYGFRISAMNVNGIGLASDETLMATLPSEPDPVGVLWNVSGSGTTVTFAWNAPNDRGKPIEFYQISTAGLPHLLFSVIGNSTTTEYTDTGLRPGGVNYYRVRAYNQIGYGNFSAPYAFRTLATVPSPPLSVQASSIGPDYVILSWTYGRGTGSSVLFSQVLVELVGNSSWSISGQTASGEEATSFQVTGLKPGFPYQAQVRSKNAIGWSDFSNLVLFNTSITYPSAPPAPSTTAVTSITISLSWTDPTEDGGSPIIDYYLEVDDGFHGPFSRVSCPTAAVLRLCTATDLAPNIYRFRLQAVNVVNINGTGSWSREISVATIFSGFHFYEFKDSDQSNLTLLGDATIKQHAGVIRLTPSTPEALGAAWYTDPLLVTEGFDTFFRFRIHNGSDTCKFVKNLEWYCDYRGGEGFAFVVMAESNPSNQSATLSLGDGVSSLGYGGLPNTIAIEFDTVHNVFNHDHYDNHVAVMTRGTAPNDADHLLEVASNSHVPNLADGNIHNIRMVYSPKLALSTSALMNFQMNAYGTQLLSGYEGGSLVVYVDDLVTPVIAVPLRLEGFLNFSETGLGHVGFTASCGSAFQTHDILSWLFRAGQADD
mmetsp:Transcript_7809/g.12489  ORF Transcript_7809/g.12489 Transcript_7809/m.12489 type:complete len:899 (+) Transcript_7809:43-2739(+)